MTTKMRQIQWFSFAAVILAGTSDAVGSCQHNCTNLWPRIDIAVKGIDVRHPNVEPRNIISLFDNCCNAHQTQQHCNSSGPGKAFSVPDVFAPDITCGPDTSTSYHTLNWRNTFADTDTFSKQVYDLPLQRLPHHPRQFRAQKGGNINPSSTHFFHSVVVMLFAIQRVTWSVHLRDDVDLPPLSDFVQNHWFQQLTQYKNLTTIHDVKAFERFFGNFGVFLYRKSAFGCEMAYLHGAECYRTEVDHGHGAPWIQQTSQLYGRGGIYGRGRYEPAGGGQNLSTPVQWIPNNVPSRACLHPRTKDYILERLRKMGWAPQCRQSPVRLYGRRPVYIHQLVNETRFPGLAWSFFQAERMYMLWTTLNQYVDAELQALEQQFIHEQPVSLETTLQQLNRTRVFVHVVRDGINDTFVPMRTRIRAAYHQALLDAGRLQWTSAEWQARKCLHVTEAQENEFFEMFRYLLDIANSDYTSQCADVRGTDVCDSCDAPKEDLRRTWQYLTVSSKGWTRGELVHLPAHRTGPPLTKTRLVRNHFLPK